ncbi:hypothetical protein BE21_58675 [Sorangium cellulosum]|uniref:VCBS repeat-containing protein n=1 Tax=Sorangium cellulosum TaxID=56 RepID=A0A150U1N8_SORCE|nr:hypothetical protein BE21_58675 [Sorangium cellulosum]
MGDYPIAVAVSDLDGDGRPDVAVANKNSNDVSVLLNKGSGMFDAAVNYPAGTQPNAIAAADLNGDGRPDLAVVSRTLRVLINQGNGTFAAAGDYVTNAEASAIVAADFDGDGHVDIALNNENDARHYAFVLLRNQGDGTFDAATGYVTDWTATAIAAADLNGDGRPDLAAHLLYAAPPAPGRLQGLSVLINDGSGRFATPVSCGLPATAIAAVDVNGDGRPDLVAPGTDVSNPTGVRVLLNQGNGTFPSVVPYPSPYDLSMIAATDLNSDGHPDLVGTSDNNFSVIVMQSHGDGTFAQLVAPISGLEEMAVAAGDFDGDGRADVVVAHGGEHGHGRVRLVPSTSHGLGSNFYPAGEGPVAMAAGDLDRDGHLDLAVANDPHTPGESAMHVLLNHGDGTFAGATSHGDPSRSSGIIVTDCTGDDAPDVVLMDRHLTVMSNQGDGTFNGRYPVASTGSPVAVAVADLDGDGRVDFAIVNTVGEVELKLSQSDSLSSRNLDGIGTSIVATDVDGDGHPDLAIGLKDLFPGHGPVPDAAVSVLRNQGDGTFEDAVNYVFGSAVSAIVAADFDGDGHPDLAALGGDVSLFRNQGDGTFDVSTIVSLGQLSAHGGSAAADLDGDGHLDLAIPGSVEGASGGLLVLRGHGDGTFAAAEDYGIGGIGGLIAEDFDADGRPDLAFLGSNGYAWGAHVLINTCLP